ncbi:hypothetical protein E2C01_048798 [Portunus trituberculatus]|uniref:Uncharacterized protein n=1 Tax=Portunus trituberculatus TaxID=210409 RepID=A0A5B7GB43_PORTR|nr:hypothetical protein [Portunus trituberculatus]
MPANRNVKKKKLNFQRYLGNKRKDKRCCYASKWIRGNVS